MPRKLSKCITALLLFIVPCSLFPALAQELNCKVSIQHARIQNVDAQVFRTMERSIAEFLNSRKWTTDEWTATERIDVNVMMNLTEKPDPNDDVYKATFSIQASRPVYNASYTTPTVNFIDRDIVFRYSQFNPLVFDDNRVTGADALASNLPAVLAYYMYLILGLDYESFAPNGGSAYFKRAQNVVNNAPEQGSTISGWRATEGNRNRYWLVDQILNPRFAAMRTYWYSMHREGLDNMFSQPDESRKKILGGLPALAQMNRENPSSILLQFFFNAKSDELIRILTQAPREERSQYVALLMAMDVANVRKYEALK
jgi:hypothetical protein